MGAVWKARDTRLVRIVAIKRLRAPNADRFDKEARPIAALNHPHIYQVYDVGPDDLVLEYIEGHPIRGPLPVGEVPRLVMQIAGAFEGAHGKGILHGDRRRHVTEGDHCENRRLRIGPIEAIDGTTVVDIKPALR